MQEQVKSLSKNHLLETIEGFAVIGSVGGVVTSVFSQQILFASLPLSAAVLLNWVNRRLLIASLEQSQKTAITQVLEQSAIPQERFTSISSQVAQLQQANVNFNCTQTENNAAFNQLREANSNIASKVEQLTYQITQLQSNKPVSHASDYTYQEPENLQEILEEQARLAKTVNYLQEIDRCNQTIQLNPNSATAYFNRAQIYEQLGEKSAAIADYEQAIRLDNNYTEAYYNRGVAYVELGHKKLALKDFRAAAKLYFAKGDITNYQKAKSLSQDIHQLKTSNDSVNSPLVEKMFSATTK